MRLTAAQALIRFLAAQYVERDGVEHRFFGGCSGIFGHGNVAGIGQALLEAQRTGSRFTVASAAPVTMFVAPGPIEVVHTIAPRRFFARA